ncbi:MAG TPA: ABC transporter ATP-binding protein [Flavipsychrobacter sp.]|nr:ABC transporter ATP-binding protein [Flavipsychrobacter sp.]
MQEAHPILSVQNLQIGFEGTHPFTAVHDISFKLEKGKTLAIVGESGSGKSLTAFAIMGLLPGNATLKGEINLFTNNQQCNLTQITDNDTWYQLRGKDIGIIFQEPMSSLNPIMTIGRQLTESTITHQNVTESQAKKMAIGWLRKVQLPNPEKIYSRYPHQLSGGQKQRVMIAIAMCNNPVLLIADEPTTALDVTIQKEIVRLMQQLQKEHNTALIFITHDLALAATIADEVLVMYQGNIMEYGSAQQVLKSPQHPYTKALLASKPTPQQKNHLLPTVSDFLAADTTQSSIDLIHQTQYSTNASNENLLQVNNLRIWFAEDKNLFGKPLQYFKAVDDVSFTLRKGEILGLVGESGCGKSTLSRSLIGLLPVREGQIIFKGKDLAHVAKREWRTIRQQIQMIFQDPYSSLNPRMTIGDALMEPMLVHKIVPRKQLKQEAQRLLDLVHLPSDSLKRYPHQFSGGQRQRIGIARALSLRPQLLICDESISALDVSVQAQILNLLKELQQEFQLTYLFISHDLSVVYYISDRVMVMQQGKIVETGEAEQVLKHPKDAYTQRLIDAMP